jgi:hypothetical protein
MAPFTNPFLGEVSGMSSFKPLLVGLLVLPMLVREDYKGALYSCECSGGMRTKGGLARTQAQEKAIEGDERTA